MTSVPIAEAMPPPAAPRSRITVGRVLRIAFDLTPLVGVHLAVLVLPFIPTLGVQFSWMSVLLVFIVTRIAGFGVTAGLHRYFSHHAFKTSRWFQFLLGAAGCTALQKGPLWWAAHHRLHHKHSDKEHDPHSPVLGGFWHGHVGWLFSQDLMHPDPKLTRDLAKYRELVWLDKLWMVPGVLLAAACYLVDGLSGVVWGYCLSVALIFQMTFLVNSVGHLFGTQRFATGDGSRNNFFLGTFGLGDGWHNNHHRAPASARHGFAWYELDMTYSMIKLWKWMGLVWNLKLPPAELLRGEDNRRPAAPPAPVPPVAPQPEPPLAA